MFRVSLLNVIGAIVAVLFLNGCSGYPPTRPFFSKFNIPGITGSWPQPLAPTPAPASLARGEHQDFWQDGGGDGGARIVVKLGAQRAYFYRGRKLVGSTRVSTGKKGFATPPGRYSVVQKNRDHVSSLYGDYVDENGDVVQSNVDTSKSKPPPGAKYRGAKMPYFLRFAGGYGLHAGRVPNHPASHGCVRLPSRMAQRFYENAYTGMPLEVEL